MRARVGSQAKTENQTWQENEIGRGRGRSTERCRNGKSKITRDTGCTQPAETKKEKKKKKSIIKF